MIISPTRTVVLAIVFHGSGHSKNVYDDDDDVSRGDCSLSPCLHSLKCCAWPNRATGNRIATYLAVSVVIDYSIVAPA